MPTIEIPAGERGTTRVFSLSMPVVEAITLRGSATRQKNLLGAEDLAPEGIEVFALDDLGDLGLAGYLREGVDVPEDVLRRDRAKLAALEGWVLLVHSTAFMGAGATLSPQPPLTLIGTYAQTAPDNTPVELTSQAAQPYTGTPEPAPTPPAKTRASGSLVVVLLAALGAGVLWWALR